MDSILKKYRLLKDNIPDGFSYNQIIFDNENNPIDYIILEVNPAFEEITGFSGDEVVGKKATEVYPGIEKWEFDWLGTYGKTALSGESTRVESYFESAGRWYEITACSEEQGYFALIFRDITAYKQLEESKEKYRQLVENVNEIIYILDENARITYITPNAKSISGYSVEELLNRRFIDFVHPDDLQGRMEQFKRIMAGSNEATEYRFITKDGSVAWVRTNAKPVVKEGKVVGVQGVLADITARKEAEEKIRYLSFHDSLTGLYNRAYLDEEMKRLDTERQLPISIIMGDLNGLKLVNDIYGHKTGDEMIFWAANILKEVCRQEDIIARLGGDEFVILLPKTREEKARSICRRIKNKSKSVSVKDIPLSISLGAAAKNTTDEDLMEVFNMAEDDMYKTKLAEEQSAGSAMLDTLLQKLEGKSFETKKHIECMLYVARRIGEKIMLPDSELNRLEHLIRLHDIGMISISEDILKKKGSLTEKEWEIIKKHPETGCRIARTTEEYVHVAAEILSHHENWNGSGYPQGLKEKETPLLSRITAVADAYEVMKNGRPYKKALSREEIINEFQKCSGRQFDPELVEVFLELLLEEESEIDSACQ